MRIAYGTRRSREPSGTNTIFRSHKQLYFKLTLPYGYVYPAGSGMELERPYGYLVNVNHPQVRPLFEMFKAFLKQPHLPVTDEERRLFEADLILNVFRAEFEKSEIYSNVEVDRCVGIIIKSGELAAEWRRYRERQTNIHRSE